MANVDTVREMATKLKIEKRIKGNRIVGALGFRQHFSSHPNRHSWNICGHPVYWWVMKQAVETKYLEKILLWTEDKEAQKIAKEMSDKFVVINREIEECKEPMWEFVDDLKSNNSRVNNIRPLFGHWSDRDDEIKKALGFEPTLFVWFQANQPLIRATSVTKMIEKYFEDDIAECSVLAIKNYHPPHFFIQDPNYPEYLIQIGFGTQYTTRQERPDTFTPIGPSISSTAKIYSISTRMVYVEVNRDEFADIHNEEDLEYAEYKMKKRIENERK